MTQMEGDPGLIPVSGRSPAEENDNPLQYSRLENSMERGWDTIHGVAKSRTQMNNTFIVKGVHFSLSTDLASISHILKCLIYYIFTKFEIKFPLF